eukprot:gnl/MRDRNA2_/MRDRNA2_27273_c0_seq1.p1 gnl/MRDRNA2_/MRDRNA2_27273_c0~~gnl/MRDRNA2_/MRDRNA2_27273_c0_seq1.p1  ORF type:complete len:267 (+),score=22.44 gnl/MRDRNA2_/MRDRNA2_27273_c0_seq1:110-802(+)
MASVTSVNFEKIDAAQSCSATVAPVASYIKQPDGSLWLVTPAGLERADENQALSPRMKQGSPENLNPGVAIATFWKALSRRDLIRNLLNIELLIDVLLGAVGLLELMGNPEVKQSVTTAFWWIPVLWLMYAGVQFALGLLVISNARHDLYRWLVITSATSILMHLTIAGMTSMSGLPKDIPQESLAAALIPITVFTDMPMRMAIGFHAMLLHRELRYVYQVPISVLREVS